MGGLDVFAVLGRDELGGTRAIKGVRLIADHLHERRVGEGKLEVPVEPADRLGLALDDAPVALLAFTQELAVMLKLRHHLVEAVHQRPQFAVPDLWHVEPGGAALADAAHGLPEDIQGREDRRHLTAGEEGGQQDREQQHRQNHDGRRLEPGNEAFQARHQNEVADGFSGGPNRFAQRDPLMLHRAGRAIQGCR